MAKDPQQKKGRPEGNQAPNSKAIRYPGHQFHTA